MRLRHSPLALGAVAALAVCGDDGDDTAVADESPATPAMSQPADTIAAEPASTAAAEPADIVDTAVAAGDFGTLVTAVQAAELEETLRGEGPSPSSPRPTTPSPPCRRARWTSCSPIRPATWPAS